MSNTLYASHLGLGDQLLCVPLYCELSNRFGPINVVTSKEALPLMQKFTTGRPIIFHVIERPERVTERPFISIVAAYAKDRDLRPVFLGWELQGLIKSLQPHLNEVEIFYRLAGVDPAIFNSFNLDNFFKASEFDQFKFEASPYVLIQTFPGTVREIPDLTLQEIKARGLEIVENPIEYTFDRLVHLVKNAEELHLVNSSLLCLALLLKPRAKVKSIYLIREDLYPGLRFYDMTWIEFALHDKSNNSLKLPKKIDRALNYSRAESKSQIFWRRKAFELITYILFQKLEKDFWKIKKGWFQDD